MLLLLLFRFLSVRMCVLFSSLTGISVRKVSGALWCDDSDVKRIGDVRLWFYWFIHSSLLLSVHSLRLHSSHTHAHTTTFPNSMFYMSIKCLPFSVILLNDKYGKATKFTVISIQTSYDLSDLYYYGLIILYTFWNLAVYGVSCAMEINEFHECSTHFHKPQSKYFSFLWISFSPRFEWISSLLWWRQNWNSKWIRINWNTNKKNHHFRFVCINQPARELINGKKPNFIYIIRHVLW